MLHLTRHGFNGLIRGMQGIDWGSLVFDHPGLIVHITVDQHRVTVLCLNEGSSLGVNIDVNEFLKAPLVGLPIETGD